MHQQPALVVCLRRGQVLHYDEICLYSNRWHRSVRARPTSYSREEAEVRAAVRELSGSSVFSIGSAIAREDCAGEARHRRLSTSRGNESCYE